MKINAMVAIGDQNQIALDNKLPWHYPEDLALFKDKVKGKTVLLGRLTYESMPKSFFKTVTPIIVTSAIENYDLAVESLEDGIELAKDMDQDELWILGGASVYEEALNKKLVNTLHISHIPYDGPADRYFPSFIQLVDGVSYGETIHSPSNRKSFRYKVYELESSNTWQPALWGNTFDRSIVQVPDLGMGATSGFAYTEPQLYPNTNTTVILDGAALPATDVQTALDSISMGTRWIQPPSDLENTPDGSTWLDPNGTLMMQVNGRPVEVGGVDYGSSDRTNEYVNQNDTALNCLRNIVDGTLNKYVGSKMNYEHMYSISNEFTADILDTVASHDPDHALRITRESVMETAHTNPIYIMGQAHAVNYTDYGRTATMQLKAEGRFLGQYIQLNFDIEFR